MIVCPAGIHLNPTGNRMVALGMLKAFGLTVEQIETAQDKRGEAPALAPAGSTAKWFRVISFGPIIHR